MTGSRAYGRQDSCLDKTKENYSHGEKESFDGKNSKPVSVDETMRRIEEIIKSQGGSVFACSNHGRNASEVGMKLPPNKVNRLRLAESRDLLMQQDPSISLELPLTLSPFGKMRTARFGLVPRIWRRSPPNTGWKTAASSRRCKRP